MWLRRILSFFAGAVTYWIEFAASIGIAKLVSDIKHTPFSWALAEHIRWGMLLGTIAIAGIILLKLSRDIKE